MRFYLALKYIGRLLGLTRTEKTEGLEGRVYSSFNLVDENPHRRRETEGSSNPNFPQREESIAKSIESGLRFRIVYPNESDSSD